MTLGPLPDNLVTAAPDDVEIYRASIVSDQVVKSSDDSSFGRASDKASLRSSHSSASSGTTNSKRVTYVYCTLHTILSPCLKGNAKVRSENRVLGSVVRFT